MAKAEMTLAEAIRAVIRIVKEAMTSSNKLAYMLANITELVDSLKVIVDFILDQMRDDRVMSTQDTKGFIELEMVLQDVVGVSRWQAEKTAEPLAWVSLLKLIVLLLEMLKGE